LPDTIYACGLRLLEGTRLQVPDVDSARMLLHIHGKNKQDRYVPLPESTLQLLRTGARTAYHYGSFRRPPGTVWRTVWPMMADR
jgi:site-specific recombinase XerD